MAGTQRGSRKRTPFPTRQLTILALCRICEPIAFMSIFPYVYFMIEDFFRDDPSKKGSASIAVYAGMVTSAFAFAEFSSGVPWGRLSDKVGRKPVLITGLAGTALSMLIFGFAPNLPVALLARALGGLLNGNIGVLQTTVAEMVTVKEHQPRAYTIMPFVWCLGSILGPSLGGALAKPHDSWPAAFPADSIWARRPYLLPNLVCTAIVLCGVIIGILFLEETHAEKKHRRDPGLEAGKWLLNQLARFSWCGESKASRNEKLAVDADDALSLLSDDEQPSGYSTTDTRSPRLQSTPSQQASSSLDVDEERDGGLSSQSRPAASRAFTRHVVLNIVGYGILAYHTMTYDAMLPTLLSTKEPEDGPHLKLPFKFVSGYGLTTKDIGVVLSVQGVYSMIATVFIFPFVVRKIGALRLFRTISLSYPLLYIVTPYMVLLPESLRMAGVYTLVIWKCTCATMAYPSNAILLTNSAPSLLMLGTINGVAASTASLSRAFGPTISGILFSAGLKLGYSGLAWWCSALITVVGAIISLKMKDEGGRMDTETVDEDDDLPYEDHVIIDQGGLDSAISAAEPLVTDIDVEDLDLLDLEIPKE